MWRRESGNLVSRPLDNNNGTRNERGCMTSDPVVIILQPSNVKHYPTSSSSTSAITRELIPLLVELPSKSSTLIPTNNKDSIILPSKLQHRKGGGGDILDSTSQWHSSSLYRQSLRLRNIGPPRRCESSELADSPVRTETIKLVRGLNRAVANHVSLAALLGGSGDGPNLRDELRRARRTAQEAAAAVRATLLPSLMDQRWAEKERWELERLWHLLLCCLDTLEISMQRSLVLLRDFSLADGTSLLIHTGLEPPNHHHHHHHYLHHHHHQHHHSLRQNQSSSSFRGGGSESTDVPLLDKLAMEGVEASQLCKELFELRIQLQELKSAVEIRSLSPPLSTNVTPTHDIGGTSSGDKPRRIDTLLSINGTDLLGGGIGGNSDGCSIPSDETESNDSELGSQAEAITGAQRRCICWILAIMVSAFLIAMLIGIFVALFS